MVRLLALVVLLGCASEPGGTLDASVHDTGGVDSFVASDTGEGSDAGPRADTGTDSGGDAPAEPVDCSAVGGELCAAFEGSCEVVFHDGEGCASVCASAGLTCLESYENVDDACAADRTRPGLDCADTGHESDFCVCGRGECTPSCEGRTCGPDGCGGSCGECMDEPRCDTTPYDPDALLDELVGFGRRAVGGDPVNVFRVTSDAGSGSGSLRAALESDEDYWIVFDIGRDSSARIDLGDDPVRVRSHKTLDGRGRDVTIDGAIEMRDGVRNVIFTDVRMTNTHGTRCTQEADVVLIRGDGAASPGEYENRDIWFHHVDMFEGGDGLIDVRGGSRITISWSHFHDHSKGFLLSQAGADEIEGREMEITFHHNFFDRISKRSPRLTYGRVHYFNNYNYQWWEYGVASVHGAQLLSEANVYEARPGRTCGSIFNGCMDPAPCGDRDYEVSKLAVSNDWAAESDRGYVRSVDDLLLEEATVAVRDPSRVFTPDYGYTAEPATPALATRVRNGAGPRVDYCR